MTHSWTMWLMSGLLRVCWRKAVGLWADKVLRCLTADTVRSFALAQGRNLKRSSLPFQVQEEQHSDVAFEDSVSHNQGSKTAPWVPRSTDHFLPFWGSPYSNDSQEFAKAAKICNRVWMRARFEAWKAPLLTPPKLMFVTCIAPFISQKLQVYDWRPSSPTFQLKLIANQPLLSKVIYVHPW